MSDSSLIARKLGETDFWLLAAPAYLQRCGPPRRVEDLRRHRLVLFPAKGAVRWSLTSATRTVEVEVEGQLRADDLGFCRSAVLEGAGIGFLPAMATRALVESGDLVRVLPSYAGQGSALYLVYPSAEYLPAKVAVFRDFVVENSLLA